MKLLLVLLTMTMTLNENIFCTSCSSRCGPFCHQASPLLLQSKKSCTIISRVQKEEAFCFAIEAGILKIELNFYKGRERFFCRKLPLQCYYYNYYCYRCCSMKQTVLLADFYPLARLNDNQGGEICFILKSFDFHFAYVATSSSSMVEIFFSKRPMTKEYFQQFRTKEKLLARLEWIDLCIRCQTLSAQFFTFTIVWP
ncbi:hypothetical protein T05_435 [Trichinella murrelli]|uniref:Uncharacterized protein n=1 Tax=Trichinella murrelli TaxID=144512 RepID=A0A0V0U2C6_9BILA|nr:hypothetical protein T05_435 [Trichinella murrelli]